MRPQAADGEVIHRHQLVRVHAPAVALIGDGGIHITVTEHDLPFVQSRSDDFAHMLGAIRQKQEQLRLAAQPCGPGVQQHGAEPAPQRTAAGLARRADCIPFILKMVGQQALGRGFARPFYAFKSNKH